MFIFDPFDKIDWRECNLNATETYGIIYEAKNKINNKCYIGQTKKSFTIRKSAHLRDYNEERFSHIAFYRALRKYGEENFEWSVIDYATSAEELDEKEIYWIKKESSYGSSGYNMTVGGQGVRGYKVTEEGIQRRRNVVNKMWKNGHQKFIRSAEDNARSLLKNKEVREIVEMLIKKSHTYDELSSLYKVSKGVIAGIKNGVSYTSIVSDEEVKLMDRRHEGDPKRTRDLTEEDVLNLKDELLTSNLSITEIYNKYEINSGIMNYILYRSGFSHLFTEDEIKKIRNRKNKRFLAIEEVIEIKEMIEDNLYSPKEIAMIFDLEHRTISKIKRGERWSNVLIDLPMEDIETYEWKYIDWKPQKPNHKF